MTPLSSMRCAAFTLMAAAALLAGPVPAGATTLRQMDLDELAVRADRIVHARAVDKKTYWDETGTRIYTDTTFEVLGEAKGQGPRRLTVSMLGGRIDPAEMTVEGTPSFSLGDEVVLFTSPRPDGKKNLVGFSQGAMRVLEDPGTGEKFAVSGVPAGVTFVEDSGGHPSVIHPSPHQVPLEQLFDQIRRKQEEGGPAVPRVSKTPQRLDTDDADRRKP